MGKKQGLPRADTTVTFLDYIQIRISNTYAHYLFIIYLFLGAPDFPVVSKTNWNDDDSKGHPFDKRRHFTYLSTKVSKLPLILNPTHGLPTLLLLLLARSDGTPTERLAAGLTCHHSRTRTTARPPTRRLTRANPAWRPR